LHLVTVECLRYLFFLIELSVLRFTDSDYPFGIFKLFLICTQISNRYLFLTAVIWHILQQAYYDKLRQLMTYYSSQWHILQQSMNRCLEPVLMIQQSFNGRNDNSPFHMEREVRPLSRNPNFQSIIAVYIFWKVGKQIYDIYYSNLWHITAVNDIYYSNLWHITAVNDILQKSVTYITATYNIFMSLTAVICYRLL
jgi:hypothetical protein